MLIQNICVFPGFLPPSKNMNISSTGDLEYALDVSGVCVLSRVSCLSPDDH